MNRRLNAQMMIIVEDENHLLLDAFEDFIQEYVSGALGLLFDSVLGMTSGVITGGPRQRTEHHTLKA